MSNSNQVEMNDVQGLILRGYNFPNIRYIILSIKDTAGAQKFCSDLASGTGPGGLSITTAEPWENMQKPEYCLNIGFTYSGLQTLIGSANCNTVNYYSSDEVVVSFTNGAASDAAAMGDTGESAPANWWKNGGWIPKEPPSATWSA